MVTKKQIQASKKNIKKAQKTWQEMTPRQRAIRQPQGRFRKSPGTGEQGQYYRIIVRSKSRFVTFRTHDIGRIDHTQRITGKKSSGSWATHCWLINKDDAYEEDGILKSDSSKIKKILDRLRGPIKKNKKNIFRAKPIKNIPEKKKPTRRQMSAWKKNIKKAQKAKKTR